MAMVDWATVFDEIRPEAGASASDLNQLIAKVGQPLPESYLTFLGWSNGGWFRTGEREFGFFPALDSRVGVLDMRDGYELPLYMPGALPFAFNGAGTFYLFDLRNPNGSGEYPVVCAHAGNLGWQADECYPVAATFEMACRGTVNVDDLRWGRA